MWSDKEFFFTRHLLNLVHKMVQYKINLQKYNKWYIYTDFTSEYNVFAIICDKHLIDKYVGGTTNHKKLKMKS